MRLCEVENCGRKHYGKGLCKRHWQRLARTGRLDADRATSLAQAHAEGRMGDYAHFKGKRGADTTQWKGDDVGYRAAHSRVVVARGKAAQHSCVDCGLDAMDWSHRHGTTLSDPANYDPRCRKCHSAYDRPAKLAECVA